MFLQHFRTYIDLNSRFSKPVFEEKFKKINYLFYNKIGFWKSHYRGPIWTDLGPSTSKAPL